MKKIIAGIVGVLVIADVGLLVMNSDVAMPGSILYQADLAMEKVQIYLAPVSEQPALKFKVINERISEVEQLIKTRRLEAGKDAIVFSSRESGDINIALSDVATFLEKENDLTRKTEVEQHLAELLALIQLDKNVNIQKHDGVSQIEQTIETPVTVPVEKITPVDQSVDGGTMVKPPKPIDDDLDFEDEEFDD